MLAVQLLAAAGVSWVGGDESPVQLAGDVAPEGMHDLRAANAGIAA